MKDDGFDLTESYYSDGYKSRKERQISMIKQNYPEYVDGDWVLWVIPDLYHAVPIDKLIASIEIKKTDGSVMDTSYISRKPYTNKHIYQLSMKSGRKRLYGIPLVFKTYQELCAVSDIVIKWEIYEKWSLGESDEPLDIHVKQVVVDYHLDFTQNSEHPDYRFYTVSSKDSIHDPVPFKYNENVGYFSEFDTAVAVNGSVECATDDWELDVQGVSVLNREVNHTLKRAEQRAVDELSKLSINQKTATSLLETAQVKNQMLWNGVYYKKSETLTAQYMADLLTEAAVGFAG